MTPEEIAELRNLALDYLDSFEDDLARWAFLTLEVLNSLPK